MCNASGTEVESTDYMPFGGVRDHTGTEIFNYKFTDQELDAEYGLYNYGARLYDPIIGRFISPDTIVPRPFNPQSLNRYTYCLNNPLIYVDPSGFEVEVITDPKTGALIEIIFREYRDNPYRDLYGLLAGPIINWLQQQEQIMSYREQWMKENLPDPFQNVSLGGGPSGSGGGSGGNPNKPDDQSNDDNNTDISETQAKEQANLTPGDENKITGVIKFIIKVEIANVLIIAGAETGRHGIILTASGFGSEPETGLAGILIGTTGLGVTSLGLLQIGIGVDIYADMLRNEFGLPEWFDIIHNFELLPDE